MSLGTAWASSSITRSTRQCSRGSRERSVGSTNQLFDIGQPLVQQAIQAGQKPPNERLVGSQHYPLLIEPGNWDSTLLRRATGVAVQPVRARRGLRRLGDGLPRGAGNPGGALPSPLCFHPIGAGPAGTIPLSASTSRRFPDARWRHAGHVESAWLLVAAATACAPAPGWSPPRAVAPGTDDAGARLAARPVSTAPPGAPVPEAAGAQSNGGAAPAAPWKSATYVTLWFELDVAEVPEVATPLLNLVAAGLRARTDVTSLAIVWSRGVGEAPALGERRAQAVRALLLAKGFEPSRLQTRSGAQTPTDANGPGHSTSRYRNSDHRRTADRRQGAAERGRQSCGGHRWHRRSLRTRRHARRPPRRPRHARRRGGVAESGTGLPELPGPLGTARQSSGAQAAPAGPAMAARAAARAPTAKGPARFPMSNRSASRACAAGRRGVPARIPTLSSPPVIAPTITGPPAVEPPSKRSARAERSRSV